MKVTWMVVVLAAMVLVVESSARPLFAARERKDCVFCHYNPAGGGARNPNGLAYAAGGFSFPEGFVPWKRSGARAGTQSGWQEDSDEDEFSLDFEDDEDFPSASVQVLESISDRLSISGRIVMAQTWSPDPKANKPGQDRLLSASTGSGNCDSCHGNVWTPQNEMILMSGRLDVTMRVSHSFSFVYSMDLGNTREVYGLVSLAPGALSLKVGMFVLPFGLRLADHTPFVRSKMNVGSNKRDVGMSLEGVLSRFSYSLSFTRGGERRGNTSPTLQFEGGSGQKAYALSLGARLGAGQFGVSFLKDRGPFIDRYQNDSADNRVVYRIAENPLGYDQLRMAVFGSYAGYAARIGWSVESELVIGSDKETRTDLTGIDSPAKFSRMASYTQLTLSPYNSLDLRARYEFFDPSRDHKNNAISNTSLGLEYRITPNLSLDGRYRIRWEHEDVNNNDVLALMKVHF